MAGGNNGQAIDAGTSAVPKKAEESTKELDLFKHYTNFENIWEKDENGVEFIYARDLQEVLGYAEWRRFQNQLRKLKSPVNPMDIRS